MIDLYRYSSEERAAFAYIDRYMKSIERLSPATEFSPLGFALAGLFLTYRAANHSGVRMTTQVGDIDFSADSIHYRRLAEFEPLTGESFGSTHEYLRLSRINTFKFFLVRPDRNLFRIATRVKSKAECRVHWGLLW